MNSKEALERLYLGIYSPNEMANYYDLVLKSLERLEHYDLIKSDMDIFEKYRDDLNYICNLLNTYCKDREDWNSIVFKFQSIIGAINCCQLQQGAYDRLEVLEKENQQLLVNKNVAQALAIKYEKENEKLKKFVEIIIREKIKPSAFLGILKNYKEVYGVDLPFKKASIFLDFNGTEQEYELLKDILGD